MPGKWVSTISQNIQSSNNQVIIACSNDGTEWLHTVNTHHFRNVTTNPQSLVHHILIRKEKKSFKKLYLYSTANI